MNLRKTAVLILGAVISSITLNCGVSLAADAPITLQAKDVALTANSNGSVQVNVAGSPRMVITGYYIFWAPPRTNGGTTSLVTLPDGKQSIQVAYKIANDASGQVRIQGQFTPFDHGVHVSFDVWGVNNLLRGTSKMSLAILPTSLLKSTGATGFYMPTRWVRDANGGVPYEESAGNYFFCKWPDMNAIWLIDHTNPKKEEGGNATLPAQSAEGSHFTAQGDIYFGNQSLEGLAAQYIQQALSLKIWTDKDFNIWDNASAPLTLQTQTVNVSEEKEPVELSWWARDYDGKVVAQGKDTKVLSAGEAWDHALQFPAPQRGILFVEVDAKSGNDAVFRRTNLAVLPPHQFTPGQDSIFGLSAVFLNPPPQESLIGLLQRMGVRWVRNTQLDPAEAAKAGIFQNYHSDSAPDRYQNEPDKKTDWITTQLKTADDKNAVYWEFGNEWNSLFSKAAYDKNADLYTKDWLPLIDQLRQKTGAKVKIMSIGFSNDAVPFLQKIDDAGEWNMLDAVALHLGRGNYTPDYAGKVPWTFMGDLLKVKDFLAQHPEKPLFITEAYACTKPNGHWYDTLRHAAENVVLSYALAKAEGVKVMDWYQLNDGTWFAPNRVNPQSDEFSYGLLNADLSPKPSLLGYNAIAEALDGATFVRELDFKDANNKGLLFDTPRGPMTVLWNRSDGYVLNGPNSKTYAAQEPWIDPWKTKVSIILPAATTKVRVIDNIGREKDITAKDHQVQLTLDGAPQIVYGLNPQELPAS